MTALLLEIEAKNRWYSNKVIHLGPGAPKYFIYILLPPTKIHLFYDFFCNRHKNYDSTSQTFKFFTFTLFTLIHFYIIYNIYTNNG